MYIWDTGSYISIYVVLTYNINNIKYTNMYYVSFSNYFQIIFIYIYIISYHLPQNAGKAPGVNRESKGPSDANVPDQPAAPHLP